MAVKNNYSDQVATSMQIEHTKEQLMINKQKKMFAAGNQNK